MSHVYQRRGELAGTRCEVNSLVALSGEVQMVASGATKLKAPPEARHPQRTRYGLATGGFGPRYRRKAALTHDDDYYLRPCAYGGRLGRRASRGIGLTARLCRNSWRRHFSTCTCTYLLDKHKRRIGEKRRVEPLLGPRVRTTPLRKTRLAWAAPAASRRRRRP